jgi:hypothetical protein
MCCHVSFPSACPGCRPAVTVFLQDACTERRRACISRPEGVYCGAAGHRWRWEWAPLTPCWFGFVARGGHGGGSARGTGLVGTSTYVGGWEFGRSGSGSVQVQPACPGQRTSTSCTVRYCECAAPGSGPPLAGRADLAPVSLLSKSCYATRKPRIWWVLRSSTALYSYSVW